MPDYDVEPAGEESEANVCDNIPTFECTLPGASDDELEPFCGELVVFEPRQGFGDDDYAINGETSSNQYRSYIRRDVAMLVKYVTTRVRRTAQAEGSAFGDNVPWLAT